MGSKIKDEKKAKDLFGYNSSFGSYDLSLVAEEKENLSAEELTKFLEDDETRRAVEELRARRTEAAQAARKPRGRPRNEDSDKETRMTFIVDKTQLEKIREIGYRERKFTKEILYKALEDLISDYEARNGEVIPKGKSKLD